MKMLAAMVAMTLLTRPVPAGASDYLNNSGNELLAHCEDENYVNQGVCLGIVQASWNAVSLIAVMMKRDPCIPDTVTLGQMQEVMLAYMRAHPAERSDNVITIMARATRASWTCE